ncbi:MAG: hypothetical protein RMJ97_02495 [Raineya sp.]|nr:hypothetical protein [Raineya sp.]MDW8295730.1 hypothetical protein [Raineya sp.]
MKQIFVKTLFVWLLSSLALQAQTVEVEKMHELSKRAKRGYLQHVNQDAETGNIDLIFITSQNQRRIKMEIYSFDKEYNLLDQRQEEQEIENNRIKLRLGKNDVEIKVKYKEPIVREGISVERNFTGTLVLKRKRVTYTWSTFLQEYTKSVETLEKVKPKTEEGDKYLPLSYYEDDYTGDAVVLATPKNEMGYKRLTLMKFNKDLDMVAKKDIDYPYAMKAFYKAVVNRKNPDDEDIAIAEGAFLMLAPSRWGREKAPRDKTNEFEILRFDNDFKNIVRVPFKAATSLWRIDDDFANGNNHYFYGLSADSKGKYFDQIVNPNKFKSIQIMKYNDETDQVEYITNTNLDEMKAKIKTPPAQKRKPVFKGDQFERKIAFINDRNEFILSGQNFKVSSKGKVFQDVITLYFDSKGVLKAMYGVDPIENNKWAKAFGAPQYILDVGDSKQNMYLILTEIDGFDVGDNRLEIYPRIAKISKNDASISNFTTLGVLNKKKFYLDKNFPFFKPEPNKITFFGSTSNGKYIYFGRVRMD